MCLDELKIISPADVSFPFSFEYGGSFVYRGKPSEEFIDSWKKEQSTKTIEDGKTLISTTLTDPKSGLRVRWDVTKFPDYPALDWVFYFENIGNMETYIVEDVKALDITFDSPLDGDSPYILHKTNGSPTAPTDFEASAAVVNSGNTETFSGGGGRSSQKDFPFFKVDMAGRSVIMAVGWSGQWASTFESPDNKRLHITAGLEKTRFRLLPGEKVRSPRILLLNWEGDSLESNAQFRQLIYKHYAAKFNGEKPMPFLFHNTYFAHLWLNENNAENQISLIDAYSKIGVKYLVTDAGWFTGGWSTGVGSWDARKDAYPDGIGPVAQAAKDRDMVYGLWFEPERVFEGTTIQREHPDWCLRKTHDADRGYLLNFGLPEVQDYFFNIVKSYMELPGFRFYRQDFNMNPLPYWRFNDAPDRQGITEMKYIEGMYAFWDRIASTWPDSLREECASGGRRVDIETVARMHMHQDSDYIFYYDIDQCQTYGLNQYLPNNVVVGHIKEFDDYSFHSVIPSSLCLGWAADDPDFDAKRAQEMMKRFMETRHLVIGAWYPLLPYTRDTNQWMASQYHRPDLDEGMILVYRHAESPYSMVQVALHGLNPDAVYELAYDSSGEEVRAKGSELMKEFLIELKSKHSSELIVYRKVAD